MIKEFSRCILFAEEMCSDLGELTNGVRIGDSVQIGAKINYECRKGYRLVGSPLLTCKRGGNWDNSKPVCQRVGELLLSR